MPYGYVGDISDKIKQSKKNNGVLTVNEIADLQTDGSWGGSMELIQEQTADGSADTVDFTSIKESKYDIHYLTYSNVGATGSDYDSIYIRLFEGGVIESAGVYHFGYFRLRVNGGENDYNSTTSSSWPTHYGGVATGANEKINLFVYFYNLGNASAMSYYTFQGSCVPSYSEGGVFSTVLGSGFLPQTSSVDGIRLFNNQATGSSNIASGSNFKLFGVKQI